MSLTSEHTTGASATRISVADKYVARLLMVAFVLPPTLQAASTIAAALYFFIRAIVLKQKVPKRNYLSALLLSSLFFLYLVAVPFTPSEYLESLSLESQQRVSLLLLPFVFAVATPAFGRVITGELIFFVYGCFVSCLAGNADFLYHLWAGKGVYQFSHVEYRSIFNAFTRVHPTYMGMYLCFSIGILLFTPAAGSHTATAVKYFLLFSLVIFLLALGPKAPLITLAIILVHYTYKHRAGLMKHKALLIASVLLPVAAWLLIPFVRQRTMETIEGLRSGGNAVDNSVTMRKAIWNMDVSMVQHYWLTGVGPGRLTHSLKEHYFFYSLCNPQPVPYHDPHSEYFYQWICFGILGLLLFVGVLMVHVARALKNKDYLYLYLLVILYTTFFTETALSMQQGVLLFAVFTSLFYFYPSYGKPAGKHT